MHETDALARAAAENARLYDADPAGTEATELADQAAGAVLDEAAQEFAVDGADIGLAGWGEKQAAAPGYVPKSPFRLVFEFDDEDKWSSVEVKDPIFIWQYVDKAGEYHADEETASVGELAVEGPIYLNLTLVRDEKQKLTGALASSSVSSEKDSAADASIRLYELSSDGSILDLRHALLTLGCGLGVLEESGMSSGYESSPGYSSGYSSGSSGESSGYSSGYSSGQSSGQESSGQSSVGSSWQSSGQSSGQESSGQSSVGSSWQSSAGQSSEGQSSVGQSSAAGPSSGQESFDSESDDSEGVEVAVDVRWECPEIIIDRVKLSIKNGVLVSKKIEPHKIMTTPHTSECCDCHH